MNTILIILFFVILFLLVYLFNFQRYFQIRYNPDLSEYIRKYSNVKKIKCNSKIIISISCRTNNTYNLKPLLASLLDQTIRIDQIALNIPYKTKNGHVYDIDKEYENIVNIYRCGCDYEKYNNIIPTLLREGDYGTIIISLDENVIYGKTFLEQLVVKSQENNNCAIFFNEGILVKPEFFNSKILYAKQIVNIKKYIKSRSINFDYYENFKI